MQNSQIQKIIESNGLDWNSKTTLHILDFDLHTLKQCLEYSNNSEHLEKCVYGMLRRLDIDVNLSTKR